MMDPSTAEALLAAKLLGIRHRAGVSAPERRGFFVRIREPSVQSRMAKARAQMADLRARLESSKA